MKIVDYQLTGEYELEVHFSDGKVVMADFQDFLMKSHNPLINQFLNPDLFRNVQLDEFGVLTWGDNEMDINPANVYAGEFSKKYLQMH